jgi:hypothetical protein
MDLKNLKIQPVLPVVTVVSALFATVWLLPLVDGCIYKHPLAKPSSSLSTDQTDLEVRDEYDRWRVMHNVGTFEWQTRSGKMLFWVSLIVIATGVGFSFWQFFEASRADRSGAEAEELQVKNAFFSIAFKSRSLATFMMFISIAYLLIYVTQIFPVRQVDAPAASDRGDEPFLLDPTDNSSDTASAAGPLNIPPPKPNDQPSSQDDRSSTERPTQPSKIAPPKPKND